MQDFTLKWKEATRTNMLVVRIETPVQSIIKDVAMALVICLLAIVLKEWGMDSFGMGVATTLVVLFIGAKWVMHTAPNMHEVPPDQVGHVIDSWLNEVNPEERINDDD